MNTFKILIKRIFALLGYSIVQSSTLEDYIEQKKNINDIKLLKALSNEHTSQILKLLPESKSQLRQDILVLSTLNFKKNGYFVEFGAADGIINSNTYLLEKRFGWTGILSEPANIWHKYIKQNRVSRIETKAVWSNTGSTISFRETQLPELSTINEFSNSDSHKNYRQPRNLYEVQTISLIDLLKKHNAPNIIDYLSIDTEGSEFEILKNFDFSKYKFNLITCEHNFNEEMRQNIFNLLSSNGYIRIHHDLSLFDDWYLRSDIQFKMPPIYDALS